MNNPRETAKLLINTAADPRTPENERVAAMVKAVNLIKEHDLLASPLDALIGVGNNETVRAASSVLSHLTSPDFVDSMKKVVNALGSGSARKPSKTAERGGGRRRR